MTKAKRSKSSAIYRSACAVIPGGVNSPVRSFPDLEMTPLIVALGQGSSIWDVDGQHFRDYCGSWGASILGHAHPRIVKAAQDQMQKGSTFGIATEVEEKFAKKIIEHVPSIEKVRFVSSGTEATMSALRLARGFTGRNGVVKFDGHYHGHVDALLIRAGSGVSYLNTEASSKGIPQGVIQHTLSLPFNDCEALQSLPEDIAAVIVEPIAGNMGVVPATAEFLRALRRETEKRGIVLIFDEVISGFRVGLSGAQGLYGIQPDLTCLGKIIGGGFPAAAFGGRREIMDHLAPLGEVYQAGTLSGNPVAMSAGLETVCALESPGFYQELTEKTEFFLDPLRKALEGQGCIQSCGSLFTLFFGPQKVSNREDLAQLDKARFKKFFHHLFERGIYIPPSPYEAWFISSAHSYEDLEQTQTIILDFLRA